MIWGLRKRPSGNTMQYAMIWGQFDRFKLGMIVGPFWNQELRFDDQTYVQELEVVQISFLRKVVLNSILETILSITQPCWDRAGQEQRYLQKTGLEMLEETNRSVTVLLSSQSLFFFPRLQEFQPRSEWVEMIGIDWKWLEIGNLKWY